MGDGLNECNISFSPLITDALSFDEIRKAQACRNEISVRSCADTDMDTLVEKDTDTDTLVENFPDAIRHLNNASALFTNWLSRNNITFINDMGEWVAAWCRESGDDSWYCDSGFSQDAIIIICIVGITGPSFTCLCICCLCCCRVCAKRRQRKRAQRRQPLLNSSYTPSFSTCETLMDKNDGNAASTAQAMSSSTSGTDKSCDTAQAMSSSTSDTDKSCGLNIAGMEKKGRAQTMPASRVVVEIP
eukprot:CAMPEP_0119305848 /NCGR_PEP_ID=MMETSP1333-20130426/6742_1 /TAXON_ID=418940 /ORGANISM="Scyphosphaera apsteinii, Strain RCC1455" /LENGTH=244 /DNA_ID=CAMNT_0007309029 /DNA_START=413 /DNA_END=1147 /DNA_ORIENTATION=-